MTKLEALRKAIKLMEHERLLLSQDRYGLLPQNPYREEWQEYCDAIREVKELAQAIQSEQVRQSLAGWQMDIMERMEHGQAAADLTDLETGGGVPA